MKCVSEGCINVENKFLPLRLLPCGHSICEACILAFDRRTSSYLKCGECSTFAEVSSKLQQSIGRHAEEVNEWMSGGGQLNGSKEFCDDMPLDLRSFGQAFKRRKISLTKPVEIVDIDLDDNGISTRKFVPIFTDGPFEKEDKIEMNTLSKLSNTAPEDFVKTVKDGIEAFCKSQKQIPLQRQLDDTEDHIEKLEQDASERFHYMHSLLELAETQLYVKLKQIKEKQCQVYKERAENNKSLRQILKKLLLESPHMLTDSDREKNRQKIIRCVGDLDRIGHFIDPRKEINIQYSVNFERTFKENLKTFVTIKSNIKLNQQVSKNVEKQELVESMDIDNLEAQNSTSALNISRDPFQKKDVVVVSSYVNPNEFKVILMSEGENYDQFQKEIDEFCNSPSNSEPSSDLFIGENLFVFSPVQVMWSRAKLLQYVREPNELKAKVLLIDYGTVELVPWNSCRKKKEALFSSRYAPFCYSCSLFNIKPNNSKEWSKEAIELFKNYVHEKQLHMIVFETKDDVWQVDLYHYELEDVSCGNSSLIQAYIFLNLAQEVTSNLFKFDYVVNDSSKFFPRLEQLEHEQCLSVIVSHVESPDLFYIQLQKYHSQLLQLTSELQSDYKKLDQGLYTCYYPTENLPCIAQFTDDNYYRAIIRKVIRTNPVQVIVLYVDFGNQQQLDISRLRLIKDKFLGFPIQSIPCKLADIKPKFGFKWSQNAINKFKFSISNDRGSQVLRLEVCNIYSGKYEVILTLFDGDNQVNINSNLINEGYAILSEKNSRSFNERDTPVPMSVDEERPTPANQLQGEVSALNILKDLIERNRLAKADKRESLIKVRIVEIKDPTAFWVHIDIPELRSFFNKFEENLEFEYKHSTTKFKDVTIGSKVAFLGERFERPTWMRGVVLDKLPFNHESKEEMYKVLSIDYGVDVDVPFSGLRNLKQPFRIHDPFALQCYILNLKPNSSDIWTLTSQDIFRELIEDYFKELYILVKDETFEKYSVAVKLYGKKVVIPDALEPEKIVYENIGNLLVNKGVAHFDKSTSGYQSDNDDEEVNQVQQSTIGRQEMEFSMRDNESLLSTLRKINAQENRENDLHEFFKYIDEEYPKERSFSAVATDIDPDLNILFRVWYVDGRPQPSEYINKQISRELRNKDQLMPFKGSFEKFNACTAYFDYDKTWNRAEILGISSQSIDGCGCVVRYVDYGNIDVVLVDKLSSTVFGPDVPKLALSAKLHKAKLFSEDKLQALRDEMHILIVDKLCVFTWENAFDVPMQVSVKLPDENDLRSVLLNKDLLKDETTSTEYYSVDC